MNCDNCDARIATINNDDALRAKTAIIDTPILNSHNKVEYESNHTAEHSE